jgi:L-ascorbate metabolism protein UlaG (beta-lactamase superfamily)
VEIRYFGHSAIQIAVDGATILVDPFITGNPFAESVVSADELQPDVILLTHAHGDHWGDTASIAKASGALVVANFDITQYLAREHAYTNAFAMNTGGMSAFAWGRLKMTYARHSSSFPDGAYGGNPNGFLLFAEGRIIYLMGDTALFAEMDWTGREYDIDVAFMPIGDCFTMGLKDSLRAAEMLKPALTVPVHYNTFPPIQVDVEDWAVSMDDAGFAARVLDPGESFGL